MRGLAQASHKAFLWENSAIKTLLWFNSLKWHCHWPLRIGLFGLLVMLVLFPRLDRLVKHLPRSVDPNALIDPQSPKLDALVLDFETERDPSWTKKELMGAIEAFVYRRIPYDWDWEIWGNADYFPTVDETLEKGREDCDGRAIVAASMLRRYGFESSIVLNFQHVWVKTDLGETMGPGERKMIEHTEKGMIIDWAALLDMPDQFCFGIEVFPLKRELIIVLGLWVLLIGRNVKLSTTLIWLALLTGGLLLIRAGEEGQDADRTRNSIGLLMALCALTALVLQSSMRAIRTRASEDIRTDEQESVE